MSVTLLLCLALRLTSPVQSATLEGATELFDVNIPSPEALIRQSLYGVGYFHRQVDDLRVDMKLPNCLGLPYSLPTIANHCGITRFSTPGLARGAANEISFSVGRWQGVDGSCIVAVFDPVKPPLNAASPAQPLLNISASQIDKLPSYDGEMLPTTYGNGCYTSQSVMKRWNRENENLADTAESSAAIADWLGGARYPSEKLTAAWTRFLARQLQVDLTGAGAPEVYPSSWNDELLSLNAFSEGGYHFTRRARGCGRHIRKRDPDSRV